MYDKPYGNEDPKNENLSTADLAGVSERNESHNVPVVSTATIPPNEEQSAQLLSPDETKDLRGRWDEIQAAFVDEPRKSVKEADNLVAAAMKRLAEMFAEERGKLEAQWDRGDEASTEDLRLALRRYRSFFNRLLSF